MRKEEILKSYRELETDEGVENIISHGRKVGLRIYNFILEEAVNFSVSIRKKSF